MNKLFDFITINLWKLTHRIIIADKIGNHQFYMKKYIPQWWFIWWHNYWREVGYQAIAPETFETMAAAYDFATPYWMPEKKCKLEFYKKQDEINKKLDEANQDF